MKSQDSFFSSSEDNKEHGNKHNVSKYEYDLYHDEDNIPGRVIQVKRVGNLKKGEKWKILQDGKSLLTIDGEELTSKEKSFLYTVDGVVFLMNFFKKGEPTLSAVKKGIKNALPKKTKPKPLEK